MLDVKDVRTAAEQVMRNYGWGYTQTLTINGIDFAIEWVADEAPDDEWSGILRVVFKIVDPETGEDRFFAKQGFYQSHCGSEWDGRFYECRPVEVTKIEYQEI